MILYNININFNLFKILIVTHITYFLHITMKARLDLQIAKFKEDSFDFFKENEIPENELLDSASTSYSQKKKKWRRKRKNSAQVKILIGEFNKNST